MTYERASQIVEAVTAANHQEANIANRQIGSIQERTWIECE